MIGLGRARMIADRARIAARCCDVVCDVTPFPPSPVDFLIRRQPAATMGSVPCGAHGGGLRAERELHDYESRPRQLGRQRAQVGEEREHMIPAL